MRWSLAPESKNPRPPSFLNGDMGGQVKPASFARAGVGTLHPLGQAPVYPGSSPNGSAAHQEAQGSDEQDAFDESGSPAEGSVADQGPSPEELLAQAMAGLLPKIQAGIQQMEGTCRRLAADARLEVLEIGFLVAQRILETEIATRKETLVSLVESALRKVSEAKKIRVLLSSEDAEAVKALKASDDGAQVGARLAQVEIVADPRLGRGDVVVESDLGRVDGRLSTRMEELRRVVMEAAQGEGEGKTP